MAEVADRRRQVVLPNGELLCHGRPGEVEKYRFRIFNRVCRHRFGKNHSSHVWRYESYHWGSKGLVRISELFWKNVCDPTILHLALFCVLHRFAPT